MAQDDKISSHCGQRTRSQPNFPSTNYIGWSQNGEKVIYTPAFSVLEWSRMHFTFKKRGRTRRARCPGQEHESQICPQAECCCRVFIVLVKAHKWEQRTSSKDLQRLYWQRPVLASSHSFETSLAPIALALLYEKCSNPTKYWYRKSFFLMQFSWSIFFYPIRFLSSFVLNWVGFGDVLSLLSFVHPPTAFITFMCQIKKPYWKTRKTHHVFQTFLAFIFAGPCI